MLIPQTPEQAIQRDQLADRANTAAPTSAATELARLRNAILEHQDAITAAGDLGPAGKFTSAQRSIISTQHEADTKLWAHLQPANAETAAGTEPTDS